SQMGRFETEVLAATDNRVALANVPGHWIDRVHNRKPPKWITLDMDSSVSPTHGAQEDTAWNGHFAACVITRCSRLQPVWPFGTVRPYGQLSHRGTCGWCRVDLQGFAGRTIHCPLSHMLCMCCRQRATTPDTSQPCPDDKVNREFKAQTPNQLCPLTDTAYQLPGNRAAISLTCRHGRTWSILRLSSTSFLERSLAPFQQICFANRLPVNGSRISAIRTVARPYPPAYADGCGFNPLWQNMF
ncbi:MAG: hypothetical protein ACI9BH_003101, partial [Paracoccaceae bacterium]